MTEIKANKLISNGFSTDEAEKLSQKIYEAIISGDQVQVDFDGVQYFTTLFFSTALTYWVGEKGSEEYARLITVKNLSESGQETYQHALDYAVEYYKMNP